MASLIDLLRQTAALPYTQEKLDLGDRNSWAMQDTLSPEEELALGDRNSRNIERTITPQEKRADKLQETHGAAGFVFEVDEKGQMVITNNERTRAALRAPETNQAPAGIASTLQALQTTTDPMARAQLIAGLQVSAATEKAKFWQQSMDMAANKLGVPGLEQALQQAEALDRSDPRWDEFQTDSPPTKQIRSQLMQARSQMDNMAKDYMTGNIQYAALEAQLGVAAQIAKRQDELQARREDKKIKLEDQRDSLLLQKQATMEMKQAQEDTELLNKVGDKAIASAVIIDPSLAGKPPLEIARHLAFQMKDKNAQAAILASEEELPQLAFGESNISAAKILAQKEAALTGRSTIEIAEQMRAIQRTMTNDKVLREAVSKLYRGDKVQQDAINQSLSKAVVGGTKEERAAAQAQKFQVALGVQAQIATNRFMSDVSKWSGYSDPAIKEAVTKAGQVAGSSKLEDVLTVYLGDTKGADRRLKVDQFIEAMRQASVGPSKSLLSPIDANIVSTQIQSLAIGQSLAMRVSKDASQIIMNTLEQIDAISPARALYRTLFGAPYEQ